MKTIGPAAALAAIMLGAAAKGAAGLHWTFAPMSDTKQFDPCTEDLAPDGAVSNRRLLADFTPDVAAGEPGLPDGMAITRDGHVFLTGLRPGAA